MLSRRNVRIKIMQVLYANHGTEESKLVASRSAFKQLVDRSHGLLLQHLLILQRTAEYAKQDLAKRQAKLLPTEDDKNFTTKLATNPVVASLGTDHELRRLYDKYKTGTTIDAEQIRKLYRAFLKTDTYKDYLSAEQAGHQDHISLLLALYKWLQGQEIFQTMVEDHFPLYGENKSLTIGALKKIVKSLPAKEDTFSVLSSSVEAVEEFGKPLLEYVIEADEQLLTRIRPVLQNWDSERVAKIDMILIKMAVGEFLRFPKIPTSVSLNEYVEISKTYSTEKSREFINGVLDKLLKQFEAEGLVSKEAQ
ncbi:MAG: transcription antitermination factor NusB [Bacteroidota bacterium]